jgi:hypothetical protein
VNGGGGAAGLSGARRGMELMGGAHMSARGERGDVEDGRRKVNRKTHYLEDTKGVQARWAGDGDGGLWRESGPAREDWADWVGS